MIASADLDFFLVSPNPKRLYFLWDETFNRFRSTMFNAEKIATGNAAPFQSFDYYFYYYYFP